MKTKLFFLILTLLVAANIIFAGTTGKISGTITDSETGMPLPGVNVMVVGTSMGAATNIDGYFVILNVPPGNYSLRATMIGYAPQEYKNVRVRIDLTSKVNMKLKSIVLSGQEVVVVAQREVVVKDISSSQANVTSETVEDLPVQNVSQVVGLQAGIVGLSVRGGGADQTAFMVDGFTLRDERTNQPYTAVSLSAIQEIKIQTGGFSAEYGNIRSGIINVVTKEGDRNRYSGTIKYQYSPAAPKHFGPSGYDPNSYWLRPFLDDAVCWTGTENGAWSLYQQRQYPRFAGWNAISEQTLQDDDPNNDLTPEAAQRVFEWQHRKQGDIKRPDFNIDAGFGGPVPFIGKKLGDLRFFLSHKQVQNMYLIPLARDGYNDNMTNLKLTSNISKNIKLMVSAMYGEIHAVNNNNVGLPGYFYSPASVADELSLRSYITGIMYGNDYWCPTHIYRHLISAKLTHTLTSRTFYEVSVERMGNLYKTVPNALRDTTKIITIGNNYQLDEAPYGYMPLPSSGIGDGLRMGVGMSNSRDYSKIFTTTFKANLTSQVNETNQVKTGVEFVYNEHNVQYGAIELTLPAGRPWSIWKKYPVRASAYMQDKLEFQGMIANVGLRFDYSSAGGFWYDIAPFDKTFYSSNYTKDIENQVPKSPAKKLYYVSPRIGISHPITDKSKLFFNYGHFRSMPQAARLYQLQRVTEGNVSRIGNPNNTLSRTVAYELGYEQELFNQYLLRLSAYYKDVSDQPNWIRYISADRKVNYLMADDNNYQDIRGFEIQLERHVGTWLSGFINYNYMVSTWGYFGKLRYYENPAEQREYDRQNIYQEKPVPRPIFRTNLVFYSPANFGPEYFGRHLLGDWLASFVVNWRAGRWATWTGGGYIPGIQYNVQWPDYFNVDFRLSKKARLGKYTVEFFMDVNNLFNNKIFSPYCFSDGNDFRDYMNSLAWPESIGKPIGLIHYGDDKIGDLRPDNVTYDPFENALSNPNNDPVIADQNRRIEARNKKRLETKSYIDNPNLKWLYYLNPRDIFFGIKIDF